MFRNNSLIAVLSVLCLFAASSPAFATFCACCAERGYYELTNAKPDKFHLDLIKEFNFDTAELYTDNAGFKAIKGLAEIEKDSEAGNDISFSIVDAFLQKSWRLYVTDGTGRKGSLVLPMPATMTRYKADHHTSESPDAVLYKEFIFNGKVATGSGFLRSANSKPTSYTLIFQGKGNMCDEASNFTHWRLQLNGAKADYAFFGKLKS